MKDIRLALTKLLLSNSTVSNLVGGIRIHPVRLPQGQKSPSVVYNRITEVNDYHMAGSSGLVTTLMQVDSWAQKHDQVVELADAVNDCLSGYRGAVPLGGGNSPEDVLNVRGIFLNNGGDEFDDVAQLFRMRRDYQIWYGAF